MKPKGHLVKKLARLISAEPSHQLHELSKGQPLLKDINVTVPELPDKRIEWKHLLDLDLPDCSGKRVDLLLGANVLEAVLQLEARTGKAGQPVAIRTVFGWTLTGTVKGFLPERTRQVMLIRKMAPDDQLGGELVLSEAAASWCARRLRRAGALRGCGELVLSEAAASWRSPRLRRAGALVGCGELVLSEAAASWCSPRLRRAGALVGCGELVLSEAAASWCSPRLRRAGALVGRGELVLSEAAASWCARRLRRAGALRGRGELVFSGAVAETLVGRGELVLSEAAASWWFSGANEPELKKKTAKEATTFVADARLAEDVWVERAASCVAELARRLVTGGRRRRDAVRGDSPLRAVAFCVLELALRAVWGRLAASLMPEAD
ncbi:hypothetical protein FJT64_000742 [Amphibalanus amphitrite]|uniref:Peptidase aspartic putative domain-containing protein n=1 Tax=Amphibalanus amphitrite TaxID=1232801 RepID=A0A6A4VJB9_AMPAM|nr:hypothetical protein FJT64_000742 [Amphibalanus amphitrite]